MTTLPLSPLTLIHSVWLLWLGAWILSGIRTKRVRQPEPIGIHLLYAPLTLLGALLLFSPTLDPVWPSRRFLPPSPLASLAGLALVLSGLALTAWARIVLGGNWSARVVLKHDHQLIRSGPYARLRHPIYTGLIAAVFGTALAAGFWHSLAGAALVALGMAWKARCEEALLIRHFGDAFLEHRRSTGFLFPRLHPPPHSLR